METIDIHKLLIDAICGCEPSLEGDLAKEYETRGFLNIDRNLQTGLAMDYSWNRAALTAQPTHVLQGVYERIAQ